MYYIKYILYFYYLNILYILLQKTPTNLKRKHSMKRVKIALQCNTAQHTSEYISQIRKSPAIPFDATKKPLAGVLKASPIPSPINPFYKRNV